MATTDFWAVEDGKLVLYKRSGECNKCGECCKAGIFYRMEVAFASRSHKTEEITVQDEGVWENREGWSIFKAQGIWWYMKIEVPPESERGDSQCGDLVGWTEGDDEPPRCVCKSWQDETFRPICRYWPMLPEHLKWFPSCGFKFEEVKDEQ